MQASGDLLIEMFWLGSVGSVVGNVPAHRAGDPCLEPWSRQEFFLKLTQDLPGS